MSEQKKERKCMLAVRIRGTISASREARETLRMLNLTRNNHAILFDDRPSFLGMIDTVRDYVTYGELSKESVASLLREKGRLAGDKRLTDEYAQKVGHKSLKELTAAIAACRVEYWKLPSIQPVFRLHPPTKGFRGKTKKSYGAGGEAGYRGEAINELIKRMV